MSSLTMLNSMSHNLWIFIDMWEPVTIFFTTFTVFLFFLILTKGSEILFQNMKTYHRSWINSLSIFFNQNKNAIRWCWELLNINIENSVVSYTYYRISSSQEIKKTKDPKYDSFFHFLFFLFFGSNQLQMKSYWAPLHKLKPHLN